MILEGFLVPNDRYLAEICDLKYFFTLTRNQCWERRSVGTLEHMYPYNIYIQTLFATVCFLMYIIYKDISK